MKLDRDLYKCTIEHIVLKGDTDLFPYPFEMNFLKDENIAICDALSALDLSNYHPISLVESLIPKSKFGFRVAHQPYLIDTIIYTALVASIYDKVEQGRDSIANNRAFAYRKAPGLGSDFFIPDRRFREWLDHISNYAFEDNYVYAIRTDISDFYHRIYRHRLENILDSLSGETKTVKKIEKIISDWRSNQSFGLPVGSSASRLLAEAALNDTDMALISEGYQFTRYVDDIIIFIKRDQDPYAALAFLAQHLSANEGLSLNNQKTKILEWKEFIQSVSQHGADDDSSKEDFATEKLFWAAYDHGGEDEDALKSLMMKDLSKELEELLSDAYWDIGTIKIVLHAMRMVKSPDVAWYIRENLAKLIPFAKDVSLLIKEFADAGISGFENMGDELVEIILSSRMRPLDCARAWFLELGIQKVVNFDASAIRKLDTLTGTLDVRQIHLLRWRNNDQNFFRSRKTKVNELNSWSQPSFIFGARCLPRDEYSHWIRGIKSRLQFPLSKEFSDWCLKTHGNDLF
ncbi:MULTISPECIES: RNA-directed DNA polymerase [Methylorubrum]|uniref:RNA-directed DNA polymerase n=1 Tax=Methylorubrum TaxID=2282523 RepID=UPI0020A06C73|nr:MULTISPECIES: RNA-directed DNA polymerase [Methylorubrum]MCP1547414.1 hypothetical protein [Methylorubrum zatmanii]MCP1555970.1 hypothetical protein [Methylorubrum extorquens]MCP1577717.1 hypothetical protein [Methylorubrum extorquens]